MNNNKNNNNNYVDIYLILDNVTCTISLYPNPNLRSRQNYYSHFMEEETEDQRLLNNIPKFLC